MPKESGGVKRESKARRAIRLCVERHGGTVQEMRWEPVGQMLEMSGREGGWSVEATFPGERHTEHFTGYSWLDVLDDIDLGRSLAARRKPKEADR